MADQLHGHEQCDQPRPAYDAHVSSIRSRPWDDLERRDRRSRCPTPRWISRRRSVPNPCAKGRDEVEQQAIDNVTTAIPGLNDKPFDEMVADEYARLQRTAVGADEQSGLQTAGEVIKGIFKTPGIGAATGDVGPEFAGGVASGFDRAAAACAELVSGAMKYSIPGMLEKAKSLLTGELDTTGEGVTKFAKKAEILAKHSKGEGVVADLGEFSGAAALDMPRIVGLTVLAGGNPVVAFGVDEALRSARAWRGLTSINSKPPLTVPLWVPSFTERVSSRTGRARKLPIVSSRPRSSRPCVIPRTRPVSRRRCVRKARQSSIVLTRARPKARRRPLRTS
jgi:hypothetical protein